MILLDTDVAVDILRGQSSAITWLRSGPISESIVLPGFVVMELMRGLRDSTEARQFDLLLSRWSVIWIDAEACEAAMRMYRGLCLGNAIGVLDALIVKTALTVNLPLYTFNVKHFKAIPGLQTIQPYARPTPTQHDRP